MALTIYPTAKIAGAENITFGDPVLIDDFVLIVAREPILIGDHVHIACFASITGGGRVEIGDCSAISQGVRVLTASDDFKGPGFGNSTVPTEYRNVRRAPVSLGRFCIVGANSVVLPGVTLGDGVSVGAGSVVTRDLAPWGVYLDNRRIANRDRDEVMSTYARMREALDDDP